MTTLPERLRSSQIHFGPDGNMQTGHGAHQVLKAAGLAGPAAAPPPKRHMPPQLTPTSNTATAQTGQANASEPQPPALDSYQQAQTSGSDHQALPLTLRVPAVRLASPHRAGPPRDGPARQGARLDSRRAIAGEVW